MSFPINAILSGDRREYARQQSENLANRMAAGGESGECKVEEACTDNVLGAAVAGLQGLTTSEKLEKMGVDPEAVNGTQKYFGF